MAGIIERNARISLILRQRVGIKDGQNQYDDYPCLGFVLDFNQNDFSVFGTVKNGKVFLVAPISNLSPCLPAQIVYDDNEYDVLVIKAYRNLKGVLLGYRFVAFEK